MANNAKQLIRKIKIGKYTEKNAVESTTSV